MKSELCQIPGVGPKMASYLEQQGIYTLADLKGKDPQEIYEKDCAAKGFRETRAPCTSGGWRSTMRKARRKTRKN